MENVRLEVFIVEEIDGGAEYRPVDDFALSVASGTAGLVVPNIGELLAMEMSDKAITATVVGKVIHYSHTGSDERFWPLVTRVTLTVRKMTKQVVGLDGATFHINVDKDSLNPADVEEAVRKGIAAAAPHIIQASVKAGRADHVRRPPSDRV